MLCRHDPDSFGGRGGMEEAETARFFHAALAFVPPIAAPLSVKSRRQRNKVG